MAEKLANARGKTVGWWLSLMTLHARSLAPLVRTRAFGVLDASAVLAILNGEAGADKLPARLLNDATVSTVSLAEEHSKLVGRGLNPDEAWDAALSPVRDSEPFSNEHARIAGGLVTQTGTSGCPWGTGLAWH